MITGIAHAAYNTKDMQATLDFYCNKLGFSHAFSLTNDQGEPWIEYVKVAPGQFVEFFYTPPVAHEQERASHLCFCVDDLVATVAALESKGTVITSPVKVGKDGNSQAWTVDPDGNRIELMQIHPDSKQARA